MKPRALIRRKPGFTVVCVDVHKVPGFSVADQRGVVFHLRFKRLILFLGKGADTCIGRDIQFTLFSL